MGARGFNVAQEGHVVPLLNPGSISGGASGVFSMRNAAKANIIIMWGALAAAQGTVQLFACSDLAGDNAVAIPFDRYTQTTAGAGNDVLGPRQQVTAAGYTPSDTANTVDVLHLQADVPSETNSPYIKLVVNDGTNADNASAVVILSGLRFAGESNQSATV